MLYAFAFGAQLACIFILPHVIDLLMSTYKTELKPAPKPQMTLVNVFRWKYENGLQRFLAAFGGQSMAFSITTCSHFTYSPLRALSLPPSAPLSAPPLIPNGEIGSETLTRPTRMCLSVCRSCSHMENFEHDSKLYTFQTMTRSEEEKNAEKLLGETRTTNRIEQN